MRNKSTLLVALFCTAALLAVTGCAKDPGMTSASPKPGGATSTTPGASTSSSTGTKTNTGTGSSTSNGSTTSASTSGSGTSTTPASGGAQGGANGSLNLGPLKVGDTADFSGLKYTLKEIQTSTDGPNLQKGEVFVFAHFIVQNGTKDTVLVSSLNGFKLLDPSGKRLSKSMFGDNVKGPTLDQNLLAGKTLDGWIAFTPKQADGDYSIEVTPVKGGKATFKFQLK